MAGDLYFVEGLFGHEWLDEHPGGVGETACVDYDQAILSLRAVIERITQVSFGDGELEVLGAQVGQIANHQHLVDVPPHFGPQVNLQIVNVVVAIPLNARQFVHFDQ